MTMPAPRERLDWVTYSGLTMHRSCPQAFSYRYLYGLEKPPEDEAQVERNFGNWWHALRAAESIERGRKAGSLRSVPPMIECTDGGPNLPTDSDALVDGVLEASERWANGLPDEHAEQWITRLGQPLTMRLVNLDRRYRDQHAEEIEAEEPIAVEVRWTRQLPGSQMPILGYADEVYRDLRRNLVVVRDHKTGKTLGTQTAADDMMDSQLHFYAWGISPMLAEWNCPPVQALCYDRVRSVAPTRPRLTQRGALSKTVTQYDLTTYLEFCESEEARERGYRPDQAIIDHLSTPAWRSVWFQRTLTPLNRNIARAHLQAAVDSQGDMQRTVAKVLKRGEATRNMSGSACRWCDFAKLCRAQMLGGPDGDYDPTEYGLRYDEATK